MKRKIIFVSIISMMLLSSCQNPFASVVSVAQSSSLIPSIETSSQNTSSGISDSIGSVSSSVAEGTYDSLAINVMTLGNHYAGDSIYIKAGDKDILIDAGSRHSSTPVVENYIDTHGCTDKSLEYLILTHGDQDHVEGMTTSGSDAGILDYYSVGAIIDNQFSNKTTVGYKNYISRRDALVTAGTTVHHTADYYFTLDDTTNEYVANSYNHIELTPTISMDVIYNYFYFNKGSDENNYSVSVMFNQGTNHFLLTGDLEESGEAKMVQYYASRDGLPHVKFFKAGHHGSYTASTSVLLDQITPEMCAVSCVAGTEEYTYNTDRQFPSQSFIDRIAPHTSKVFITSMTEYKADRYPENNRVDMNGNIVCAADSSGNVTMTGSASSISLKDTGWMKTIISRSTEESKTRVDNGVGYPRIWPSSPSTYN